MWGLMSVIAKTVVFILFILFRMVFLGVMIDRALMLNSAQPGSSRAFSCSR